MRELKLRALNEGRKLKDVAAESLQRGLAEPGLPAVRRPRKPRIEIQPDGLPLVRCGAGAPASRMSARELLALEQAALEQEDRQRAGLPV